MDWTELDIDQAAEEVWKRNHTRTKLDTIKAMMRGEKETPHALTGYRRDADFKQQQIALGQVAERLAAARLDKLDPLHVICSLPITTTAVISTLFWVGIWHLIKAIRLKWVTRTNTSTIRYVTDSDQEITIQSSSTGVSITQGRYKGSLHIKVKS